MENLKHLMAAYFHQDWWEEYGGSWTAALEDFVHRAPDRVPNTIKEISQVLETRPSDGDVARLLDEMGSYRDPGPESTAHVDWLTEIREMLSDSQNSARRPA